MGYGDIIIAAASITLMIITIDRSHKDAVDSKVLSLREDKIQSLSYTRDKVEMVGQMSPHRTIKNDSVLLRIVYDGRASAYYSIEPLAVTVVCEYPEKEPDIDKLVVRNSYNFFGKNECHGYLIETDESELLEYFTGLRGIPTQTKYKLVIDYEFRNLYPTGLIFGGIRDTFYIQEEIVISPKSRTGRCRNDELRNVFNVDYLLRRSVISSIFRYIFS